MDHFCFGPDKGRRNYNCGDFNQIFKYLINHFSQPVSTILDLTEMQGISLSLSLSPPLLPSLSYSFLPSLSLE